MEEELCPYFRADCFAHHAGFKVDTDVAELHAVPVDLGNEAQSHARGFVLNKCDESRTKCFDDAVAGAQCEGSDQMFNCKCCWRAQRCFRILNEAADCFAEFRCPWCRNKPTSGPHQKRITCRLSQAGKGPAHRGGAEAQTPGSACNAAFGK